MSIPLMVIWAAIFKQAWVMETGKDEIAVTTREYLDKIVIVAMRHPEASRSRALRVHSIDGTYGSCSSFSGCLVIFLVKLGRSSQLFWYSFIAQLGHKALVVLGARRPALHWLILFSCLSSAERLMILNIGIIFWIYSRSWSLFIFGSRLPRCQILNRVLVFGDRSTCNDRGLTF